MKLVITVNIKQERFQWFYEIHYNLFSTDTNISQCHGFNTKLFFPYSNNPLYELISQHDPTFSGLVLMSSLFFLTYKDGDDIPLCGIEWNTIKMDR